ncbi:hypothetical protein [Reichenbachiella sp.]|uniref:hypothetical protein n=1 Tax=Reichenbachiella sp. TaxID=2184521 RepID=UPI003BB037CB
MKWFLMLIGLLGIIYLIGNAWRNETADQHLKRFFFPALIFKILAGWGAGLVYHYYYNGNGDSILFFNTSWELAMAVINDPFSLKSIYSSNQEIWQGLDMLNSRTFFFIVALSIPTFFSAGIYWVASLYVSVISFFAVWYFVKSITFYYPRSEVLYASVVAFFFLPSAAFWSSGIFKECFSTVAIFLSLASIIQMTHSSGRLKYKYATGALVSIGLLLAIKYYLAGLLVPLIVVYLLKLKLNEAEGKLIQGAVVVVVVAISLFALSFFSPNLNLSMLPEVVNREYLRKVVETDPEGYVLYPNLNASWYGLIISAPKAFFVGLFSPLSFSLDNPLKFMASIENLIMIFVSIIAIWKTFIGGKFNLSNEVFFLLSYVTIASILLALTTPNIGTLSRYRVAYVPIFFFVNLVVLFSVKRSNSADEK